jgi:hypothetical protein
LIGAPLDGKDAANSVMLKVMDQIYVVASAVADLHPLVCISHHGTMHHYRSEESVESRNRWESRLQLPLCRMNGGFFSRIRTGALE